MCFFTFLDSTRLCFFTFFVRSPSIVDTFIGFKGDMAARWFEAGVAKGGDYKCPVACGFLTSDSHAYHAHTARDIPSYSELQPFATAGKYGKIPGKNLAKLTHSERGEELRARHETVPTASQDRKQTLKTYLHGVQRVPALLAYNPTVGLQDHSLERYSILPCEPLHDVKGHLANVLTELQYHISGRTKEKYIDVLNATVKRPTSRGCDWRNACVLLTAAMQNDEDCPPRARQLLTNLTEISKIAYTSEQQRSPKMVLALTLSLYKHFELLRKIMPEPHKSSPVGAAALYGGYLHDLMHSPTQLAVCSLRSGNTEQLERMQGQAKAIAVAATNRKVEDVAVETMLRLHAERNTEMKKKNESSSVSKNAKKLKPRRQTVLEPAKASVPDLMALQQNLSLFLELGEGIWWHREGTAVIFHDGDDDNEHNENGPHLCHLRSCTIQEIQNAQATAWQKILSEGVDLPLPVATPPGRETTEGLTQASHRPTTTEVVLPPQDADDNLDSPQAEVEEARQDTTTTDAAEVEEARQDITTTDAAEADEADKTILEKDNTVVHGIATTSTIHEGPYCSKTVNRIHNVT